VLDALHGSTFVLLSSLVVLTFGIIDYNLFFHHLTFNSRLIRLKPSGAFSHTLGTQSPRRTYQSTHRSPPSHRPRLTSEIESLHSVPSLTTFPPSLSPHRSRKSEYIF
jgi:hypothetical protein